MVYCVAVGCVSNTNNRNTKGNISFYRLPKEVKIKNDWIAKIKRENLPKEENVRLCHLHFEDHCFERDLQVRKYSLNL